MGDYDTPWFGDMSPKKLSLAPKLENLMNRESRFEKKEKAGDEYHTMEELYLYRMLYNALAAEAAPHLSVKSWRHSDGELCFGGGWFVVYMQLPTGQVSNHYKAEYWDLFKIPSVDVAPEYDGHTPAEAAQRMLEFLKRPVRDSTW